eukprot:391248-Pelagomonas_calceolata.AAC.4
MELDRPQQFKDANAFSINAYAGMRSRAFSKTAQWCSSCMPFGPKEYPKSYCAVHDVTTYPNSWSLLVQLEYSVLVVRGPASPEHKECIDLELGDACLHYAKVLLQGTPAMGIHEAHANDTSHRVPQARSTPSSCAAPSVSEMDAGRPVSMLVHGEHAAVMPIVANLRQTIAVA